MNKSSYAIGLLVIIAIGAIIYAISFQSNYIAASNELATVQSQSTMEIAGKVAIIQTQTAQINEIDTQINDINAQLSTLQSQLMCSNKPSSINFTSKKTVSDSMKVLLEGESANVSDASITAVWGESSNVYLFEFVQTTGNNSEILFPYIVFFEQSSQGFSNAVFDIRNMCWLVR